MTSDSAYDVIVIGGGLAGACAAFHLARAHRSVLVLEKQASPHHKVCGEFLSPETVSRLKEMDVDVVSLGAHVVTGVKLYAFNAECRVNLQPQARGLSRYKLDSMCLNRAEAAGARLQRGVSVTEFYRDGKEFVVKSSVGSFSAGNIFLATGKHDIKSARPRHGPDAKALGFKMHFHLSERGAHLLHSDVTLHFFRGGYVGLCRIEDAITNFCFMIEQKAFHDFGNNYDDCLKAILSGNRALERILLDAVPLWSKPISITPLPYGYMRLSGHKVVPTDGLFCLGDQFAVIPSLAGSGMAIALYTGKRAAEIFLEQGPAGVAAYESECAHVISSRMTVAYPLHHLCRSPRLASIVVNLLKLMPSVMGKLITWTRMPKIGRPAGNSPI